ncbi:MAG TPA: hypothetical protein VJZ49_00860 [Syntrophales bacterium]|nr:hypothetical protein [Syntrophales bacterium]
MLPVNLNDPFFAIKPFPPQNPPYFFKNEEYVACKGIDGIFNCAVEKLELARITAVFRQIPDIILADHSENLFGGKVRQAEKHGLIKLPGPRAPDLSIH